MTDQSAVIEIRKVELNELANVLSLIDEFDRLRSKPPTQMKLVDIYQSITSMGGCVVGAFKSDDLVGTCTVNVCANLSWSGRPYAIIENVIVTLGYRGKGVGKELLSFAVNQAKDAGCYKVALMTGSRRAETLKFYESAGFEQSKTGFQIRFDS